MPRLDISAPVTPETSRRPSYVGAMLSKASMASMPSTASMLPPNRSPKSSVSFVDTEVIQPQQSTNLVKVSSAPTLGSTGLVKTPSLFSSMKTIELGPENTQYNDAITAILGHRGPWPETQMAQYVKFVTKSGWAVTYCPEEKKVLASLQEGNIIYKTEIGEPNFGALKRAIERGLAQAKASAATAALMSPPSTRKWFQRGRK